MTRRYLWMSAAALFAGQIAEAGVGGEGTRGGEIRTFQIQGPQDELRVVEMSSGRREAGWSSLRVV